VNEKTHNFWAYRRFTDRLEDMCEEYGSTVKEESEAWTSQECPETRGIPRFQSWVDVKERRRD